MHALSLALDGFAMLSLVSTQLSDSYCRPFTVTLFPRIVLKKQIEITCKGQQLLPFLTLQHVRDNIWSPREVVTLIPDSSTTDHVMVLHYGRSA
ncbi:unnamed protein product [Ilex paraguariensis]|uniref:Uncharacterized protein n=1 Tax=Ilex paraguariensis TaxID=185542 RepID=A0ABC8RHV8_9AQUA